MIRDRATDTVKVYNGLSELPGDVVIGTAPQWNATDREVDWTGPDGNSRANVVYLTGEVQGHVTYNLFFFNGRQGASVRDGTKGTLNGVAETFITADMGTDNIRNSTNGVWNAAGTQFPNSVGPNNPGGYTANTRAIYVRDTGSNVTCDQVTNTITVSGLTAPYAGCNGTYYLNPGVTKIVGDQLEYLNGHPNNDLAIVFEQGGVKAVTQLYMTTGPNWTPGMVRHSR